jgi:hypothetical protein
VRLLDFWLYYGFLQEQTIFKTGGFGPLLLPLVGMDGWSEIAFFAWYGERHPHFQHPFMALRGPSTLIGIHSIPHYIAASLNGREFLAP